MPWKESDTVDQRYQFVMSALREDVPFAELCRQYDISAKTGYKWIERFLAEGLAGLADLSRRPHSSPAAVGEDIICELVRLKGLHPKWGPAKIRQLFIRGRPGCDAPALSSVKRILAKAGLVEPRKRRRRSTSARIVQQRQAQEPNDIWSVDFKGHWYSTQNQRVLPLTVCDAFSRFILLLEVVPDASSATVRACFEQLFAVYGLPRLIRSDNGSPFACTTAPLGLSRLSSWWLALGIGLDRIAPGHPEQNGRHERMHRDIALEVEGRIDGDLRMQQAALELWREEYNQLRPHAALGLRVPADLYNRSARKFDPLAVEQQYPLDFLRRRVNAAGRIKLDGRAPIVSTALCGWELGLQQERPEGYRVWFGGLCIGLLDIRGEKLHAPGQEQLR